MTGELAIKTLGHLSSATPSAYSLVQIAEIGVERGTWDMPATSDVSLALSLSDISATWFEAGTLRSGTVKAGNTSICRVEEYRQFEMKADGRFALFSLPATTFRDSKPALGRALQPQDLLDDSSLRALLRVLLVEKRNGFASGLLFSDSMTTSLTEYLKGRYSRLASGPYKGGLARSVLRRCLEYIDAHLHHDLRLEDLAHQTGVSASHLIRGFRASTGRTPYQFVLERRVERAKELMQDSRLGLTEIALATGFANQHHLSRVFRKAAGVTPREFRLSLD